MYIAKEPFLPCCSLWSTSLQLILVSVTVVFGATQQLMDKLGFHLFLSSCIKERQDRAFNDS